MFFSWSPVLIEARPQHRESFIRQLADEHLKETWPMPAPTKIFFAATVFVLTLSGLARGSTRTVETPFALSRDARSQFRTKFPLLSAGRITVEADWHSKGNSGAPPASLTMVLRRPDGSVAARNTGMSVLRLEQATGDQDLENANNGGKWELELRNDLDAIPSEVSGTVRITIPAASRAIENTQFTLLGSGNAEEIPFSIPAPGKIQVSVEWNVDAGSPLPGQVALIVSLIHPGESRTYARRQGKSPVTVEQQISEQALDLGVRWSVRVQNDSQTKVSGTVKITYTPSL
jgi:hypothetical protein